MCHIRLSKNVHKNIFGLQSAEKNNNIQLEPEKQYSHVKKECMLKYTFLVFPSGHGNEFCSLIGS